MPNDGHYIPTAVVGTRRNLARDNADLRTATAVGLAGTVSPFAASQISVGLDERLSNRLFAGPLLVVATSQLWDNRRPDAGGGDARPGAVGSVIHPPGRTEPLGAAERR